MPRPKAPLPAYRHHKSTGRAVTYVNRKAVYLGKWDSAESHQRYAEVISKLTAGETVVSSARPAIREPVRNSIASLCLRFKAEKLPQYSRAEQACIRGAVRILLELFGPTPTADFGPVRLRTVRKAMVEGDPYAVDANGEVKPRNPWSRSFVNKQVKRLRCIFSWGVSWELVPGQVASDLRHVESLRAGETEAPEGRPRRAVPDADLQAVRAVLCEKHRDIFDMMLLTGARPGELLNLTVGMVDRSTELWKAELANHKTRHLGKTRTLHFNSSAQAILLRHMKANPDARFFTIRTDTFSTAVKEACAKAGVAAFTPHWLRHTVATRLADELGTEFSQRLLGHATAAMAEHYSRAAQKKAIEAAKKLGERA